MRYGFFDNQNKEYVVENPNTPTSWVNYLGTSEFCGIISNNASGYSFYKSAKTGRLTRFRFNSIPADRPGRYIYLRDNESNDYWSASWQPVAKPLDTYKSICRHGLGYSKFESEYAGIKSNMRVFVPVDKPVEFWEIEVENCSNKKRDLSLFTYAEWCFWDMNQDSGNFQYILYTCRMAFKDDIVDYSIVLWPFSEPKGFMSSLLPVVSYDTDRDVFIGQYRHEGTPIAVEKGHCSNSIAVGGTPCGSVQNRITLAPGEKKYALFIVGVGDAQTVGQEYKRTYIDKKRVDVEFAKVQEYWHNRMNKFTCETPSDEINTMVNIWNQYQCQTTFNWSRSASFNEAGGRDGLGFRDTNQDVLGVLHSIPELVKNKIIDLLKGQFSFGAAMHGIQPLSWKQGEHNVPPEQHIFSDDHLWLLISIPAYCKETNDLAFLQKIVPFADKGEATVYEHCKAALEFSWSKRGPHGFLLGMAADWNDCINLKGQGESIWSTFLFYKALDEFIRIAEKCGKQADVDHFKGYESEIRKLLDTLAWDGEWFLRGYLDNGEKLGSSENKGSKIFINSQTWAVVSGAVDKEKQIKAMDSLGKLLATEHGIVKNYPAYTEANNDIGAITAFPPGLKENGGIFCHANTWAVIAEALLGRSDKAFAYYRAFLPAAKNDTADQYSMEPYVYSQFITGKEHPYHFGRARNSWLTGTATWSFVAASQYILGVRADYDGLIVDPCVPSSWDGFTVTRVFRGKSVTIKVTNPDHVGYGVKSIGIGNEQLSGTFIPADKIKNGATINVTMGK